MTRMLVLARKPDQKIVIGDNIVITLVEIRGNVARIGVEAPDDVRVDREEIRELREANERESCEPMYGRTFAACR